MPAMGSTSAQPVADRIGALAHSEPDRLISIDDGSVVGAVWSHSPVVAQVAGLEQHAIVLHLAGSTLVEKWRGGRMIGHRSRIGSVTLVPAQATTTWALSGHSRVAHLYLDPRQLALTAERSDGPSCEPELRDFFAEPDEVTAALVRLVLAQSTSGVLDRLAHDEITLMLARHLLGRYAAGRPLTAATVRSAVARAAGFGGASHFSASFRRLVGTSPTVWRTERRH
jgi:AraC family transcriptional regulator